MKSGHPELGKSPYAKRHKVPYRYSETVLRLTALAKSGQADGPEAKALKERHLEYMGITPIEGSPWPQWTYANA